MVDIARLSIAVDTTDLMRGEAAIEALGNEAARAETKVESFGNSATRTGVKAKQMGTGVAAAAKSSGAFGSQMQSASFQIADFAIQTKAGTSASATFARSAMHLLGVFGPWAAALGAVVAVGTVLIPVLFRARDGVKDFGKTLDAVTTSTRFLERELQALKDLQEDYASAVVAGQDRIVEAIGREIELRAKILQIQRLDQEQRIADLRAAVETSQSAFEDVVASARKEISAIDQDLQNAQFARTQGQRAALDALLETFSANEEVTRELQRQTAELELAELRLERVDALLKEAAGTAPTLAEGLSDAADEAGRIAQNLERANSMGLGGSAMGPDDARAQLYDEGRIGGTLTGVISQTSTGGASGVSAASVGGGAASAFAGRIQSLLASLQTERETLEAWREESMMLLNEANAQELAILGGHNEARLRLEEEYQNRLRDVQDRERQVRMEGISGALGDASALMTTGSKKLFNIGKAAAIADATISGYDAAVSAWAKGMKVGGPPVAAAFTAASLARTGALIAGIASTSFGGGGGSVGPGPSVAAAANVNSSPRVALQLIGSETATFNAGQIRTLINAINEETESGAIVRLV